MSIGMALSIFCLLFLGLGFILGHTLFKALHQCPLPGIPKRVQDVLSYVRMLLINYHAAHKTSPLTNTEIEEILTLCKAEIDKILEGKC